MSFNKEITFVKQVERTAKRNTAGMNNVEPLPHPSVMIMIDNLEAMKTLAETLQTATRKLMEQKQEAA